MFSTSVSDHSSEHKQENLSYADVRYPMDSAIFSTALPQNDFSSFKASLVKELRNERIIPSEDKTIMRDFKQGLRFYNDENYGEAENAFKLAYAKKDPEAAYKLGLLHLDRALLPGQISIDSKQLDDAARYFRDAYDRGMVGDVRVKFELMFELYNKTKVQSLAGFVAFNFSFEPFMFIYHFNIIFGNTIRLSQYMQRADYVKNGNYSDLQWDPLSAAHDITTNPERTKGYLRPLKKIYQEYISPRQAFNLLTPEELVMCLEEYPNDLKNKIAPLLNSNLAKKLKIHLAKNLPNLPTLPDDIKDIILAYYDENNWVKYNDLHNLLKPHTLTEVKVQDNVTDPNAEVNQLISHRNILLAKFSEIHERLPSITKMRRSLLMKVTLGLIIGLVVGVSSASALELSKLTAAVIFVIAGGAMGTLIGCCCSITSQKELIQYDDLAQEISVLSEKINALQSPRFTARQQAVALARIATQQAPDLETQSRPIVYAFGMENKHEGKKHEEPLREAFSDLEEPLLPREHRTPKTTV
jgi:hypothetical protein